MAFIVVGTSRFLMEVRRSHDVEKMTFAITSVVK
jgi:hypothetical protein